MNIGYNITKTTRMSYLLRDRQGSYEIMQPYVWNHLCYSYRKPGFSKAVLVCLLQLYLFQKVIFITFLLFSQNGHLLNVNFERDTHLLEMTVPLELLQKVLLMRCLLGTKPDCTMPGGMITDFNIWDRSFSAKDMTKWTTCQYTIFYNKLYN